MNQTNTNNTAPTRLLTLEFLKDYLSVGRTSAERIAKAANAKIKIGGRAVYDRTKIDAYLDTLTQ